MNLNKIKFSTLVVIAAFATLGNTPVKAANVVVTTDTVTNLDIQWTINPIDTGGSPLPTFDIPILTNWQILSADYVYHGGGTPSDVNIQVQHIVPPHPGDNPNGDVASIGFSFLYTATPGIGGTVGPVTVLHRPIPHYDTYNIAWGYANIGGGGTLVTQLTGVHSVPEPLTLLGSMTALGLGLGLKRKITKK